ncbi:MAG: N-acetylglucosamine-6-phosphate deacetylase [Nitriliruptoraceae bacterium]
MDLLTAPRILLADELVGPGWVQLDGGVIVACGHGQPPTEATLALSRGVLAPGLIDIQINGGWGYDFADTDAAGWHEVASRLPETGVTAFVPTIITAPIEELAASMIRYREIRPELDESGGARSIGLHCEGPFLAAGRHGAHREGLLIDPSPAGIEALLSAADGTMAYLTLAPERLGALTAIRELIDAGVRVAIGHSDATDQQVLAAADAGASLVTHLFNAQRPLHHRDPGVVGAGLADPRLTLGLIVDLFHVAPTAVRATFAAAAGRVALVTDAISAFGMPPGTYDLGGQRTTVGAGVPPVLDDGTLAGSVLRLDEAVGNTISAGVDPATALTAATRVPAEAVGRHDLGRLAPGAPADLVWLDEDWRAASTWIRGERVHIDRERAPS